MVLTFSAHAHLPSWSLTSHYISVSESGCTMKPRGTKTCWKSRVSLTAFLCVQLQNRNAIAACLWLSTSALISVKLVTRPQSQNVSRVPSSFCCILKYLFYVPLTLSWSLVIAYLAAEMIMHSGSSDQSSIQLSIRTSVKTWREEGFGSAKESGIANKKVQICYHCPVKPQITIDLVLGLIFRVVDPKLPWALKIYEMQLIFGYSALGKLG